MDKTNFPLEMFLPSFIKASEEAAIATSSWIGKGDKIAADKAATDAMRAVLKNSPINGIVVIGEGEMDEAPMLYNGEEFFYSDLLPKLDIAVDPLEGTNLCAKNMPGAMTSIAFAPEGSILRCPDMYMEKLVVTPSCSHVVNLNQSLEENLIKLAEAKNSETSALRMIILDRERHKSYINTARKLNVSVTLLSDGDIGAVISVLLGNHDIYCGSGGAPEGVLGCFAVKALKGEMYGKLIFENEVQKTQAREYGITDFNKQYSSDDMIRSDGYLILSGVTSGDVLKGVEISKEHVNVNSLVFSTKKHNFYNLISKTTLFQ
jgi:fructose-1,6-bisphosphatase II